MPFLTKGRISAPISERCNEKWVGARSDDAAVLAGFLRVLALLEQPESDAGKTEQNHTKVEGIAQGHQNGFKGPFNELADGGDEFLEVHIV